VLIVRLVKNGSSIAVNIPREVLREREWQRGDTFALEVLPRGLTLRRVDEAQLDRAIAAAVDETPLVRRAR
jgi:antitoxin component of MazEF toxin-antitoxin module